jgi:hypothetical protein
MKTIKKLGMIFTPLFVCGIIIAAFRAFADPPQPVISIAPVGTNQLSIIVTNGVNTANYDLYWTPVLANPDYPWSAAAIGSTGQTNFVVDIGPFSSGYYQVYLDTNGIPLWKAADPNNPGAGILAITIDNPTNGMVLQ